MFDVSKYIHRVPFDPRREQPGPSEQWVTLWPLSESESTYTLKLIEEAKPQGIVFHGNAYDLTRSLEGIARRMRNRFGPELGFAGAIAGDSDNPRIPGFIDGWIPALQLMKSLGFKFGQPNRESAQKSHPKGSGETDLNKIRQAIGDFPLYHTSFGAPANIDKNLVKAGHQSFGGHSGGSLWDMSDDNDDVDAEVPQIYLASSDGEHGDRDGQLLLADAFARSNAEARKIGRLSKTLPIYVYLQAYNVRPDVSCIVSEYFKLTQWWTGTKGRCDDAGIIAIAVMSELFRRGQTIEQFQKEAGLVVDRLVGPKTYDALLPTAPWVHPQSKDGKSPKQLNANEVR